MKFYDMKEKVPDEYEVVGLYFFIKSLNDEYTLTLGLGYFTDVSKRKFTTINFAKYYEDGTIRVAQNEVSFDDVFRWTDMVIPGDIFNEGIMELEKRNKEKENAV